MDADDPDGDPDPGAAEADGGVPAASEDAVADRVGPDAVAGTVTVAGTDIPVALDDSIVEAARDADDVDLDRIRDAATPDNTQIAGDVPDDFDYDLSPRSGRVHAQDDSATIPVQDRRDALLTTTHDVSDFDFIQDPQIRKLQQNSVDYTHRVGRYLLAKDDLIPGVKERIKALIVGSEGMAVEPSDPERDADQRLADHLRELYDGDIHPTDVIDVILRENLTHARTVLRATDLEELDLRTLDYLKDGVSGEEIYMQDPTTVYEFDVDEGTRDDPGDINIERRRVDSQPLVIGEQVFDISLYDTPPLKAVVDTTINKMVMQRLKARKAELTSFGAVYATVEPPSYLPEGQYFDRVQDDDYDTGGTPPTKLERALRENMESAFDHLKDWQSGTTAAIPDYWSFEQIEIPENNEPLDKQIRGYNRSIARRMLVPLDLIELRDGAELSRETLFRTLMTTIAGWRQEIIRVFDQFARVQTDIHGLDGSVEHTFPPIQDQDEELVVQALQYAGIAGLTEKEVRQMLNNIEGIDLNVSDTGPQPPSGGPDDAGDRSQRMQDFLNEQNDRGRQPQDQGDQGDDGGDPAGQDGGDRGPPATALSDDAAGDFPATCRSCGDRRRIAGRFKCPACADDVDADSFDGDLADATGQAADVDLSIPDAVQNAAQMALDARDDPDVTVNGMTDRGWSRADTLAAGGTLSPGDIVGSSDAMANWWSRHFDNTIDASGDRTTLQHAGVDNPWAENSYTAGKGWGGVAGARFAFRKAAELTDGDASDGWRDWVDRVQALLITGRVNAPPVPAAAATRYSEGDEVDTPQGPGVVVEIRTESFEGPGGSDVEPSDNSPAYVVAVESGAEVYRADDLSDGTIDVDGVDDPAGDLGDDAEAGGVDAANPDDGRRFDYPDSWDESPTPNRIILLKAWAGLGGRFTSCRRKMAGNVASPARFCASLKDRVLEWEGWRQGG
jgi:hypothetical protein